MKIGELLRVTQEDVYNKLIKNKKHRRRREKSIEMDELTFSDIEKLMWHDSHKRGPKGAIRQITWGK